MSLEVSGLTKIYGSQRAVDDVSFEASKGLITGFLGPNGAGKSTTMKIATGYLSPSSGTVYLNGIDVQKDPISVKSFTGYLPEHNPLYLEMYVREFLRFIGRAYGIRKIRNRVEEMIDRVGLADESNKKVGALSKGYRQRVGLAQALIHDPSILILDEPTTGLDPNQIIEVRNVIKEIAADKTVILSTHIMQEVEAMCDKVVIIDKGRIVADDNVSVLKTNTNAQESFHLAFESEVDAEVFRSFTILSGSERAMKIANDRENLRAEILKVISENDLPLVSITKNEERSLEEVFRNLTGKEASR